MTARKPCIFSIVLIALLFIRLTDAYSVKYYSYQSGNWTGSNVWTTDSTGTTLVNPATPAANDIVCILTGRTILASANITTTGLTIIINAGGVLNMDDKTIPAITLNGKGKIRTRRVSGGIALLPVVSGGNFLAQNGGTVEYFATSGNFYIDDNIATYGNLLINLGSVSQVITVRRNLSIWGSLTISRGTFQINDATNNKRSIAIVGDVLVDANGRISTGTGNPNTSNYTVASNPPPVGQFHLIFHQFSVGGNFTNNGIVRFTNLTAPNYGEFATNGAVTVRFTGEADKTVTLNGITDFYNLIVDKGSDQTYVLTINSADNGYFSLYGSNAMKRNLTAPFTEDNPEVRKALWLKNGTLRLTGKILIPSLAEGPVGPADQNGDYAIGLNAQLWIDGPDVEVYVTATNNSGFPQAPVGSAGVSGSSTAEQALSIFGTFRISDGYFSTRHSAGIIFWSTSVSSSMVVIEGGVLNATVLRSTWTESGKTSYVQTGGTVIVRGNETEVGEMSGVPIFNIPNPSSTFVMTGGEIIIRDRNNGTVNEGNGLFLNCDPGNFSVTGGRILFETNPVNTPSVDIYSRVNLWNLEVKRLGSTGTSTLRLMYDLTVENKIQVFANAALNSGTGNFNVIVENDFLINSGGTYVPNSNTTRFQGYGNHFLWYDGSITSGLYNLEVNKPMGSMILASSSGNLTIRNDLTITAGIFADAGKIVYVAGNISNSSSHVGAGKIVMNRTTGTQVITGNGNGIFQNLEMNNTSGAAGSSAVSLGANITVTGVLSLANDRLFNIGRHQLTLGSLASVEGTMGISRYIQTSGAPSDGGLRRVFADTTTFVYPVGSGSRYTPVSIYLRKKPAVFGSVSVRPVPSRHPFVSDPTCLDGYWKVNESGFSGLQTGSVYMTFNYGTLPDNPAYIPGKYNPAAWMAINDVLLVNEADNTILFPSQNDFTGDFTAGIPAAFDTVVAFYSRASGAWTAPATWSNQGYGGVAATTVPGPDNPVFVGDGASNNHTVTVLSGIAQCGSLSIKLGSVVDIGATTGHNFGTVIPGSTGRFRISSTGATAIFPAGDFGNFLGSIGGTLEYYTNGTNFTVPVVSAAPTSRPIPVYCNLMITPASGFTVTFPDADLNIYGSVTINGASSTGIARMNQTSSRSLTIGTDLLVNGGTLQFQNGSLQSVRIDRHLTVASGAFFNIAATGTPVEHLLSIGGNITNNGTIDLSNLVGSNLYRCSTTITGSQSATISGRGTTNDYYSMTLDKGSSVTSVLNITSTGFSFSNNVLPLTLVNGTFRLSTSGLSVTVATDRFNVPPNTSLSANGGSIMVATVADNDADLILAGMLEVKSGGIYIGLAANNVNNDIEYSGAGSPTIEVSGGTLFINGQVRRSMINALGSLIYKQSGSGVITINGRNMQSTRAKLEILNTGSTFNMSGGTLNIIRGGSTPFNDLYLRPEKSTVTGGTIVFGSSATETTGNLNSFTLDSEVPLNNITVDGTTTSKTLTLAVHGITLKGSLTIQATSVFFADSLDVVIGGNLTNLNSTGTNGVNVGGFRPGSLRQVTTFNGNVATQTITGVAGNNTNFANLVVANTNAAGSLSLQANTAIRVNKDLTIGTGTLNDGGNVITVAGNIVNNFVHTGTGRILLAGTTVQVLSGNGTGKYGNLYLNSSNAVTMVNTTEITGTLTFQGSMLDIGNNLLILSGTTNPSVSGFSSTSYIRTTGLISDAGVRKHYPASALDFTFPIGCLQKYTPARINVTANSAAGTINVIPVNSKHLCTTDPGEFQLRYYWNVVPTGFQNPTISHYYTYLVTDVAGNESNYIGGRFYSGVWTQGPAVNTSQHQIRFLSVNYIEGDYTAGYPSELQPILTYYSRDATLGGNWNVNATWSNVSHDGPVATSFPTGSIVIIAPGHTVFSNGTSRKSYTLTINGNGMLDLANTVGHDFGTVTGTGTIKITPSAFSFYVFPAGNYISFMSAGGGTIELSNSSGSAVFPYPVSYNNLVLSGAGIKQMQDADILINGILTNTGGGTFTASSSGILTMKGDLINDATFLHNSGYVVFNGTTNLSGSIPLVLNRITVNQNCTLAGPSGGSFGLAGDWDNNGTFNHNNGTVSFHGSTILSGTSTTTFNRIQINSGAAFTGKLSDNFNVLSNWVNNGEFSHNSGTVTFDGNTLIGGTQITNFGNVVINENSQLTSPAGDSIRVALNFTNDGTFNSNGGTVVFNGSVQVIGGNSSTEFENIRVADGSSSSVSGADQTLRGVLLCNGTLSANNKLTLLSTPGQTALVDGTGNGDITGNLVIQRYLPSGFGYKYFSSPFQGANVGQFGEFMDLNAQFPTFYRYDENRFFTGWITYTSPGNLLEPMQGYAVNFGPLSDPDTVELFGVVNNRSMVPLTLFNSDRQFTQGYNLIGNPYPSPIDWDADSGWVRTNIDNALYYFNAGTTDQYLGTYSTYVNGISSDGIANEIIPAMQGFFVHVSDGDYPVASTLIFTNAVRVNNLSPVFHKKRPVRQALPLIRISCRNCVEGSKGDPLVVCFRDMANSGFEPENDALKLMNTDLAEPNFYSISSDSLKLSINSIPEPRDSLTEIPLGVTTWQEGNVIFRIMDYKNIPPGFYVYFCDKATGIKQNVVLHPDYLIRLEPGNYEGRFSLMFSKKDLRSEPQGDGPFHAYAFRSRIFVWCRPGYPYQRELSVYNMIGQRLYKRNLTQEGYSEIDMPLPPGIYVVTVASSESTYSNKVFLTNQ